MTSSQILVDIVQLIRDAQPIPVATDRAAVKAFATKLIPDLIDLAYDAGGFDKLKAVVASATPADIEAACSVPCAGEHDVGKFGDGAILKSLMSNLPQILSAIMTILALFPKATS